MAARRYADPWSFLANFLAAGRLAECVVDIVQAHNQEAKLESEKLLDERLWSLWLHDYRPNGGKKAYGEWKKAALGKDDPKPKATIKEGTPETMAGNLDIAFNTLKKIRHSTERR